MKPPTTRDWIVVGFTAVGYLYLIYHYGLYPWRRDRADEEVVGLDLFFIFVMQAIIPWVSLGLLLFGSLSNGLDLARWVWYQRGLPLFTLVALVSIALFI